MSEEKKDLEAHKAIVECLQEFRQELALLRAETQAVRECIVGDKLTGKVGILDLLEAHRREIYGDAATQHTGLKDLVIKVQERATKLEQERARLMAICAGVSMTIALVWALVKPYLFGK